MFLFFATSFSSSSDRFIMFILAHNYFFNIWLWLLLGWLLLRWLFLRWLLACVNQIFGYSQTLGKSKLRLTTKLPWQKLDAWAFFWTATLHHQHSILASQTCEDPYQQIKKNSFWKNSMTYGKPCHTIGHFVFYYHHVTYKTPCHASGHLVIYREC